MTKASYVKLPVMYLTQHQIDERMKQLREHSGRALDLGEVNEPGTRPQSESKSPGPEPAPQRRRRKAVCYILGPDEWNGIFPENPSEYGGVICYRE